MTTSLPMGRPASLDVGIGRVEFLPPDRLSVVNESGDRSSVDVGGIQRSGELEIYRAANWCCLIGAEDTRVIVAVPAPASIEIVGELERLDLTGKYDPGGLIFVKFLPLATGDVLLVYECGVARIDDRGIVWSQVHRDLSSHLSELTPDVVWFADAVGNRFGFRVDDGEEV